jgi:hypothetical protein
MVEALTHPLGSGNAPHINRRNKTPYFADTAAFGCYRRDVFDRVGLYNEDLHRSSDMDLNVRLRRAGGKILLVPDLVIQYIPRPGYRAFLVRNFKVGFWVAYAVKFGGRAMRLRHAAPLALLLAFMAGIASMSAFPLTGVILAAVIVLYAFAIMAISVRVAMRHRSALLGLCVPLAFATRHMAYASGSLCGISAALASPGFWRRLRASTMTPAGDVGSPLHDVHKATNG